MNLDLMAFAPSPGDNHFKEWLLKERDEAIKYLTNAADPVAISRAQGKVQLLDKQLELLEKAKNQR